MNQVRFAVRTLCRVLHVSPSGYYAWRRRAPSARTRADVGLTARIRGLHERSFGTYGAPRIRADLIDLGERVGQKRIARLMRAAALRGVSRRRGVRTTIRGQERAPAPDLVQRHFAAAGPNQLWVADITYIPTWAGFLYLAVVLDALNMALVQRRPTDVVHHSDQGSQYTSLAFGARCTEAGVRPSRGTVGDAYDNALCESFFATLECELLARRRFATKAEARMAVFYFIEGWYNPHRRHSALGYLSPIAYENAAREHGLPTAPLAPGLLRAGGGAVDNPATALCNT